MTTDGAVRLHVENGVASITFDRPHARNAMTWAMYEELGNIVTQLQADNRPRVVVFRGAGGEAFVAGTDITQFRDFRDGEDDVLYERRIDACLSLLETLPMPTVAAIDGWCVGGGLAIATACDFRIADTTARFGVPIAKTLGNTLSIANLARLSAAFGTQRTKRMLLLAQILDADEALACGFLHERCERGELENATAELIKRLTALAPITQRCVKESLRRLTTAKLPSDDDLISQCYASRDFHEGVSAFMDKRPPEWKGS